MRGEAKGAMAVVDSRSFHVVADASDPQGGKVTAALRHKNPNTLFVIARSCNLNVVVVEALIDAQHPTRLRSKPLDIYWLNLEAKYAQAARRRGSLHDRDELSWPERKLAYGAKAKPSKTVPGIFTIRMNALPSLPIRLGIDPARIAHAPISV